MKSTCSNDRASTRRSSVVEVIGNFKMKPPQANYNEVS